MPNYDDGRQDTVNEVLIQFIRVVLTLPNLF